MKSLALIMPFLLLLSCHSKERNQETGDHQVEDASQLEVEKIEIVYVDMFTTTFARVKCSEFDETFSNVKEAKTLVNPDEILEFKKLIKQTFNDKQKKENIDVRVKATMHYEDGTEKEVCLGMHGLDLEGTRYSISTEFMEYLLDLTETEESK